VTDAGLAGMVSLIREASQIALPRLWHEGQQFDFAFVDGDHHFESVFLDIYFLTRLVKPGGLVVLDDAWMPSVQKAIRYLERNTNTRLEDDAHAAAFRWSSLRRWPGRRSAVGLYDQLAVLRLPRERHETASVQLVDF